MRDEYGERAERFEAGRLAADRRSQRLAHARLAAFLALIVAAWFAVGAAPGDRPLPMALAVLGAIAFASLVGAHGRVRREERRLSALAAVNREAVARVDHAWHLLRPSPPGAPTDHPYSADLDVFGPVSLWRLLGVVSGAPGHAILRDWILSPAAPPIVRARQGAIAELAPLVDLRDALTIGGRAAGRVTAGDLERFTGWCERPAWLTARPSVLWAARLIPVATVLLVVLAANDVVPGSLWAISAAAGIALALRFRTPVGETLRDTGARATALRAYSALFARLGTEQFRAPLLRTLATPFAGSSGGAAGQMQGLQRLMEFAELRYSPMMHAVVHGLTLWDFHVVSGIEHWRASAGIHAREWLRSLGELEALAALAALRADNPEWTFPELLDDTEPVFEASALGHPLIAPGSRVSNDVIVGPPGTVLVITGSNMSGKSTLLRAIGLNAVLAQVGAPVCATALRMTPLRPYTSMRIQDSIAAGLSFFMAELTRLKAIVDAARVARAEAPPLLYLLDELLQGTNSAERQVAARTVIGHLLAQGAIGAVTTHDLELADEAPLSHAARLVHFTETVNPDGAGEAMTFDYRLRPGPATSVNALKLMEMIGLR